MLSDNSSFCDNLQFWVFSDFKEQVFQARFFDFLEPWLQLKPGIYLGIFLKIIYLCCGWRFRPVLVGYLVGGLEPLGKDLDPYTLSGTMF
jgi:hypothetical protein